MSGSIQESAISNWRANGSKRLELYPTGEDGLYIFRGRVWQVNGDGKLVQRSDLLTRQAEGVGVPRLEIARRNEETV